MTSWTPAPLSPDANEQTANTRAHVYTLYRVFANVYTGVDWYLRSVHICQRTGAQDRDTRRKPGPGSAIMKIWSERKEWKRHIARPHKSSEQLNSRRNET